MTKMDTVKGKVIFLIYITIERSIIVIHLSHQHITHFFKKKRARSGAGREGKRDIATIQEPLY